MTRQQRRRQSAIDAKLGAIEMEAIGAIQGIVTSTAGMLAIAGLVAALAERGAVDPMKVADWIDFMGSGFGADQEAAVREGVQVQLASLALMLRSMATVQSSAGRA